MQRLALTAAALVLIGSAGAAEEKKTYRSDHAVVTYSGIGEPYAKALAAVAEAARAAAVAQFGLDMPDTIAVAVEHNPRGRPRLFTDGHDRMFLTVRTERDLRRPKYSGIFTLYGVCHEIGHIAMYRTLRERGWMSSAAAEGWAHYAGSRLVDAVYAKHGEAVWPDRYDYRVDGMMRLKRQLAGRPAGTAKGAGQWMKLVEIVGAKSMPGIFKAWQGAKVDPADPGGALRKALLAAGKDKRLGDWWNRTEALFVVKREKSGFRAQTAKPGDLAGTPAELALDDGKAAGRKSIAGSAHAVAFETKGPDWYLTAVRIHGGRYGRPRPPREDFHVWLCDAEMKQIADFPFAYSKFGYGSPRWLTLKVTPTRVPPKFILCVGFNPTATKGVFVSRDAALDGRSLTGLPGESPRTFTPGDWLIRATLDQAKAADSLKPIR